MRCRRSTSIGHLGMVALAGLWLGVDLQAEDWPRFRGPNGQGICTGASLPSQWNGQKNLAWRTALPGPGSSSPIIVANRVIVSCYSGYGVDPDSPGRMDDLSRHLLCVDKNDGRVLWQKTVPREAREDDYRGYLREHGYASSTPASDGLHVYAFFGKSGVYAFDLAGELIWRTSVGTSSADRRWGSAASPVLHENLVIVNASDESRALVALDKRTGEVVWRHESRRMPLTYGTPIFVKSSTRSRELVIAIPGVVQALDPLTGDLVWSAAHGGRGNICPSPVLWKNTVIVNGGYPQKLSTAIRLGGRGDVSETHVLWSSRTTTYVPTPLVHGDHLYWIDERGTVHCQDAKTGRETWSEKLTLKGRGMRCYASPILSGDHVIAITRYSGAFVFEANPEKFALVAHNTIESDDSQFNATPAASDGKLLLRSDKALYCIESK